MGCSSSCTNINTGKVNLNLYFGDICPIDVDIPEDSTIKDNWKTIRNKLNEALPSYGEKMLGDVSKPDQFYFVLEPMKNILSIDINVEETKFVKSSNKRIRIIPKGKL